MTAAMAAAVARRVNPMDGRRRMGSSDLSQGDAFRDWALNDTTAADRHGDLIQGPGDGVRWVVAAFRVSRLHETRARKAR
jgi:hypothetical protein